MHWTLIIPGFLLPAELAKLLASAHTSQASSLRTDTAQTDAPVLAQTALADLVRKATLHPLVRIAGLTHQTARHHAWQRYSSQASSSASSTNVDPKNADPKTGPTAYEAMAHGLRATGWWWRIHPVHFQLARDHLVLTDPRELQLQANEADTLAAIAEPLLAEAGFMLHRPTPDAWFLHAPQRHSLTTYTLERVVGRNISPAMPHGDDARAWRRLLNEVQMSWHDHPVNQARESRGLWPINGLWLEGGEQQPSLASTPATDRSTSTLICASSAMVRGLAVASGLSCVAAPDAASLMQQLPTIGKPAQVLIELNHLEAAANTQDAHGWITGWQDLEQTWWQPLRAAWLGQTGSALPLNGITLHVLGHDHTRTITISRADRWKLWRSHRLADLLAEPE